MSIWLDGAVMNGQGLRGSVAFGATRPSACECPRWVADGARPGASIPAMRVWLVGVVMNGQGLGEGVAFRRVTFISGAVAV